MNMPDKEKLWVAYQDGQLSASEALAFESRLTPQERAHCAQEVRLENTLADALRSGPGCPAALWHQTLDKIRVAPPKKSWLARPAVAAAAFAGLAAAMVFTFHDAFQSPRRVDPMLAVPADLQEFTQASSTSADKEEVQAFLRQRGVDLKLEVLETVDHHPIELLGANERGCHGQAVIEVLFECCGKPAKVVLAQQDTRAEEILRDNRRGGEVLYRRDIGDYLTAVVSEHHAPDLTRLFALPAAEGTLEI
ncbi:MAG: hypothetical protein HYV26_24300 [Candidatus Hydrogenedentes bacterium]|nr:hypothetical protein [Candidatus Hydrogenedentota bacterium]